jgi:hypothetical protein
MDAPGTGRDIVQLYPIQPGISGSTYSCTAGRCTDLSLGLCCRPFVVGTGVLQRRSGRAPPSDTGCRLGIFPDSYATPQGSGIIRANRSFLYSTAVRLYGGCGRHGGSAQWWLAAGWSAAAGRPASQRKQAHKRMSKRKHNRPGRFSSIRHGRADRCFLPAKALLAAASTVPPCAPAQGAWLR